MGVNNRMHVLWDKVTVWGVRSGKRQAKVPGPLECAIANKLIQSSAGLVYTDTTQKKMGENVTPPKNKGKDTAFKLSGELLHGGKGKDK
jgi:hypothetical protein